MAFSSAAEAADPIAASWRVVFRDDFRAGSALAPGSWRLRPAGAGLPDGDGVVSTGSAGLVVVPAHTDPDTGEPAFSPTDGPLGEMDHLRWAAFADVPPPDAAGRTEVSATISAQGFGLDRHPYGDSVPDPHRELKCGAAVLICVDRPTGIVLDFIVTDRCVFAVYERLAFPGTDWAGFSYAVPVLDREPGDHHDLAILYDAPAGTARWSVGGEQVLAVDELGLRLPGEQAARFAKRDNGLRAQIAVPAQFSFGLGVFTDQVWGQGVRLAVQQFTIRQATTG
ncbi:conserved hypothetical protein [Catenulispora acidiphila DSM 44928]|uniref:Uncharacterized protein n=1 Tax=Catenulispora acidiphila (strain DSM 44928 / JCM 14897 / NBRC 102108 / NRRL B-24433 / ID139908) TaxID=479433 RepID=C7PWQ0_CATAD|nr:DUF6081 family protein [Catenulispora acidiphila]ACU75330.1 conserved hypothetical protein [Catenulispora acidiphila DSM 44928]